MFTKTDLAKFVQSWGRLPYIVSLGAQKNFAKFTDGVNLIWDKDPDYFNADYFKELVAKAILFRTLDRLIMKQPWYGGYKANIVTYSISKLAIFIHDCKKQLSFEHIWKNQSLSDPLVQLLLNIADSVNVTIQQTPEGVTNVTEWCKKEKCWDEVMKITLQAELNNISELYNV